MTYTDITARRWVEVLRLVVAERAGSIAMENLLLRTLELADGGGLGLTELWRAAQTCRAAKQLAARATSALSTAMLARIGWADDRLPTGVEGSPLRRALAARVLEGFEVKLHAPHSDPGPFHDDGADVAAERRRVESLLRAFGARVANTAWPPPEPEDGTTHRHDFAVHLFVPQPPSSPADPPIFAIPAAVLELLVFSPFVTAAAHDFLCGSQLSESQVAELWEAVAGGHFPEHEHVTLRGIRAWRNPEAHGIPVADLSAEWPNWNAIRLWTHTNARTGDMVLEWSYSPPLGAFVVTRRGSSYHWRAAGAGAETPSVLLGRQSWLDEDLSLEEDGLRALTAATDASADIRAVRSALSDLLRVVTHEYGSGLYCVGITQERWIQNFAITPAGLLGNPSARTEQWRRRRARIRMQLFESNGLLNYDYGPESPADDGSPLAHRSDRAMGQNTMSYRAGDLAGPIEGVARLMEMFTMCAALRE